MPKDSKKAFESELLPFIKKDLADAISDLHPRWWKMLEDAEERRDPALAQSIDRHKDMRRPHEEFYEDLRQEFLDWFSDNIRPIIAAIPGVMIGGRTDRVSRCIGNAVIVVEGQRQRDPVTVTISGLSSGTIASISGLRNYDDIDVYRMAFLDFVEKEVDQGHLAANVLWQEAHDMFVDSGQQAEALAQFLERWGPGRGGLQSGVLLGSCRRK